jgi:hypothetical protein
VGPADGDDGEPGDDQTSAVLVGGGDGERVTGQPDQLCGRWHVVQDVASGRCSCWSREVGQVDHLDRCESVGDHDRVRTRKCRNVARIPAAWQVSAEDTRSSRSGPPQRGTTTRQITAEAPSPVSDMTTSASRPDTHRRSDPLLVDARHTTCSAPPYVRQAAPPRAELPHLNNNSRGRRSSPGPAMGDQWETGCPDTVRRPTTRRGMSSASSSAKTSSGDIRNQLAIFKIALLIRGFGVRVPGGAPVLSRPYSHRAMRL